MICSFLYLYIAEARNPDGNGMIGRRMENGCNIMATPLYSGSADTLTLSLAFNSIANS